MPTLYYPDEGETSGFQCPRCGSVSVVCTLAIYEFTTLECRQCGNREMMDDLQIVKWFSPEN